jgi:hypothetical protein
LHANFTRKVIALNVAITDVYDGKKGIGGVDGIFASIGGIAHGRHPGEVLFELSVGGLGWVILEYVFGVVDAYIVQFLQSFF